jgi:hypothetical protein
MVTISWYSSARQSQLHIDFLPCFGYTKERVKTDHVKPLHDQHVLSIQSVVGSCGGFRRDELDGRTRAFLRVWHQ